MLTNKNSSNGFQAYVSLGAEAQPDDCRPGWVRGDHTGAFGRGAAVQPEARFDVKLARINYSLVNPFLTLSSKEP